MAYLNMKIGDMGEDVKTLKQLLRGAGYLLSDDDLFDEETYKAVSDYQRASGITPTGEIGASTWAKLAGSIVKAIPQNMNTSETVKYLEANRPAGFASDYAGRIDDVINQVLSREDFSYDPAEDGMYQKLRDETEYLGKRAMDDAIGAAAALSGGYDNSFAQTAGAHAYQDHLASFSDGMSDMYQLALSAYDAETDRLENEIKTLSEAEARAYDRYLNDVDAYQQALEYYYRKLLDEQEQANWLLKNTPAKGSGGSAKKTEEEDKTPANILTPSEFLRRKAAGSSDLKAYATYADYAAAMKKKYA